MPSKPAPQTHLDAQSTPHEETARERILRAFLALVAERGFDATTTRAVAGAAGVNEVTIFRQFTDKMTLARDAIRWLAPVDRLAGYAPAIDVTSPAAALAGLLACMRYVRALLWANRGLLQFGMSDAWRYPDLLREVERAPRAARALLERALDAARPALRADVETAPSALGLLALIFLTVLWQSHGWLSLEGAAWDDMFAANIRVLLRDAGAGSTGQGEESEAKGAEP